MVGLFYAELASGWGICFDDSYSMLSGSTGGQIFQEIGWESPGDDYPVSSGKTPGFLLSLTHPNSVISTEAVHGLIVSGAVERPRIPSLPLLIFLRSSVVRV